MSRRLPCLALLLSVGLALVGCAPTGLLLDSSPDGRQLAFTWTSGEYTGLALINLDGTGFRWVPGGDYGQFPLWSSDGRSILFSGVTRDSSPDPLLLHDRPNPLLLHDLATGETRRVAEGVVAVAWRADGQLIAGIADERQIVWLTPSGSVVSEVWLPEGVSSVLPWTFAWLPATDTVALMASRGQEADGTDLFLARPDGVTQVSQTHDVVGSGLAPDGRRLLWARGRRDRQGGLFLLYAYDWVTGRSMRLPFPSALTMLRPDPGFAPSRVVGATFAPGAARLVLLVVFTGPARPGETTPQAYVAAYALNRDGSGARLLRRTAPTPGNDPDVEFIPWWTRDGRRIVVLVPGCPGGLQLQLLVYSADGTRERTLLRAPCEK